MPTEPIFKFYALNYDVNHHKIVYYNIFNNITVHERTFKAVKKYNRFRNKAKYSKFDGTCLYGFEGFCEELRSIIMSEEWGRCEYEIMVGDLFASNTEKWDCYGQVKPNIEMIAREVIYQYKQYLKNTKN